MAYTPRPNTASFRFLFLGGWTAVKSALLGSIFAVLVTLTLSGVYAIWQNGLRAIAFNSSGLESVLSSAVFLLLVAILLSTVPAFMGGVLLAWLLSRETSPGSHSSPSKTILGATIGASAGVVLALVVLIPADFVSRAAHSGIGYNPWKSLPIHMFYAIEFIVIATMAGIWTERQLREYLRNAVPNNRGLRGLR